ncbi:MAG: hypothetical protein M3H12_02405 [Chromatiales bacterium]|nr:hypothetical protein [Gammaproteobacteria bacterium]
MTIKSITQTQPKKKGFLVNKGVVGSNTPNYMTALTPAISVSNQDFLTTVFGQDAPFAHVTGFVDDPSNIANDRRGICWGGTYFSRANGALKGATNQYFCISRFNPVDGKAVRRKSEFLATHCIVADDVKDKVPLAQARRLPPPSWRLETSPGNEQWGWVLAEPERDRARVDNLLDGLVARGLSPDGTDPGMRGVTRYVRLPEGWNTKAKYGAPFNCQLLEWRADHKVTLAELADPFGVDLDAPRAGEGVAVDLADLADHPVLDAVVVLEHKGVGEYLIECPWVEDHTDGDTSGTILYIKTSGEIGFKCHHGHCQDKTGGDLLDKLALRGTLDAWRAFKGLEIPSIPVDNSAPLAPDYLSAVPLGEVMVQRQAQPWEAAIAKLPADPAIDQVALRGVIRAIAQLPPLEMDLAAKTLKDHYRGQLSADAVRKEIHEAEKQLRKERVEAQGGHNLDISPEFAQVCQDWVYVAQIDRFINKRTLLMLPEKAFRNMFCHMESELMTLSLATGQPIRSDIVKAALDGPMVKVDGIDYYPDHPEYFDEAGVTYLNMWNGVIHRGRSGDPGVWLNHFERLGLNPEEIGHALDFMAYTLQHPGQKINHILVIGGGEGIGKDFILYPLVMALGQHSRSIDGHELSTEFNDFLMRVKHLHVNELESADKRSRVNTTAKLKPLASAPPERLSLNQKGVSKITVRNIVNVTATTNSQQPLDLMGGARRYYMIWSDISVRGGDGQMTQRWRDYWQQAWTWMRDAQSWEVCAHYLLQRDVSHFEPGAAPKITAFQEAIVEASMSPLEVYLTEMLESRDGVFQFEMVTTERIYEQIDIGGERLLKQYGMKVMPDIRYIGRSMSMLGVHQVVMSKRVAGRKRKFRVYVLDQAAFAQSCGDDQSLTYESIVGRAAQIPTYMDLLNPAFRAGSVDNSPSVDK